MLIFLDTAHLGAKMEVLPPKKFKTRLISIESQPKKDVFVVFVVVVVFVVGIVGHRNLT